MILIADSGSTKTDWAVIPSLADSQSPALSSRSLTLTTQGLNPYHQSPEAIRGILRDELLPLLPSGSAGQVWFYGSGVTPDKKPLVESLLRESLPTASSVDARSDLLGAARALCGRSEGIAAILGTGSNSCFFDGEHILRNTPPLGYILGDEGSGAVMGRLFLTALYKGFLPEEVRRDFESATGLTLSAVIDRVYRQPQANRFLASLSIFIHDHLGCEAVSELVIGNFERFFVNNVAPYRRCDLPVSFVGSIAHHFEAEVREAARRRQFTVGRILRSPLEGLVAYHCGIADK